jgi:hypothetical protein
MGVIRDAGCGLRETGTRGPDASAGFTFHESRAKCHQLLVTLKFVDRVPSDVSRVFFMGVIAKNTSTSM